MPATFRAWCRVEDRAYSVENTMLVNSWIGFRIFLVLFIFCCLMFPGRARARRNALCHFARDPARHFRPRSKTAPLQSCCCGPSRPPANAWALDLLALPCVRSYERRAPAPPTAWGGLHHESNKPSGSGRARRPAPLAHRTLLRRCMRCVQWLAKRQRQRIDIFATGTVHHLKPSIEAVN